MINKKNIQLIAFEGIQGVKMTCAKFGNQSKSVIASGDNQNNVYLWKISQIVPLMTLNYQNVTQQSQVEVQSVTFGHDDIEVFSGTSRGIINVWDINSQKIQSVLKGHTTGITALGTFSSEEYKHLLISGSYDTNIKLWDYRSKSALLTFKGHEQQINCIESCPDGRLIASGSSDGTVKLWDISMNKLMHSFVVADAQINCVRFNPKYQGLATAGADKVVKYWGLSTFQIISQTKQEATAIQQIFFTPDGSCVFSAANDSLKVWNMDKDGMLLDNICVQSGWKNIQDISLSDQGDMMLGLTIGNPQFCLWGCQIKDIKFTTQPKKSVQSNPNIKNQQPTQTNTGSNFTVNPNTNSPQSQSYYEQYVQKKNQIINTNLAQVKQNIDFALNNLNMIQNAKFNQPPNQNYNFDPQSYKLQPSNQLLSQQPFQQQSQQQPLSQQYQQQLSPQKQPQQQPQQQQQQQSLQQQQQQQQQQLQQQQQQQQQSGYSQQPPQFQVDLAKFPVQQQAQLQPQQQQQQQPVQMINIEGQLSQLSGLQPQKQTSAYQGNEQEQQYKLPPAEQIQPINNNLEQLNPSQLQKQIQNINQMQITVSKVIQPEDQNLSNQKVAIQSGQSNLSQIQQNQVKPLNIPVSETKPLNSNNQPEEIKEDIMIDEDISEKPKEKQKENQTKEQKIDPSPMNDSVYDITNKSTLFHQLVNGEDKEKFHQFDIINEISQIHPRVNEMLNSRLQYLLPIQKWWNEQNCKSALIAIQQLDNEFIIMDALEMSVNINKLQYISIDGACILVNKAQVLLTSKFLNHIICGADVTQKLLDAFKSDIINILTFPLLTKQDLQREERVKSYRRLVEEFRKIYNLPRIKKYAEKGNDQLKTKFKKILLDLCNMFSQIDGTNKNSQLPPQIQGQSSQQQQQQQSSQQQFYQQQTL